MKKRLFFLILFFTCCSALIYAQNSAVVKGFVYDAANGEPVGFAQLQLAGTAYGALTERNGSFAITKIPAGEYRLVITFFGYDSIVENISLTQGQTITKKILLQQNIVQLNSVEVSGTTQRDLNETRASVTTVTPKEIKMMPSMGGQADFAQYLQVLPGVISTGDQGGQLYIRGGTPIQNMIKLDGILIFNPFHSIGLFSVFDTEIIQTADVYTGGFGAEFGGRISSVMDISTRDGNKKRLSGRLDLGTISSKILLEGPIIKIKEASETKSGKPRTTGLNFILSAKGSYLEQATPVFYPWVKEKMPYNFLDVYGKLNLSTKQGTKFNLFGFNFMDTVNYDLAKYAWNNFGVGTNFLIVPGDVPTLIGGCIAYSHYKIRLTEASSESPRESSIGGLTASLDFTYFMGKNNLKIGLDFEGFTTTYTFHRPAFDVNRKIDDTSSVSNISLYGKFRWNIKEKILVEPGFRLQYYASLGAVYPEPRLAFKWNILKNFRFKLAGGLYSQNYTAATNDRDVVNLFYGFLSSPESVPHTFNDKEVRNALQKAQHVVFGFEYEPLSMIKINIEGYFKNFSQLINLNRYKFYEDDGKQPDFWSKDFMIETGKAYGGDITFKTEYRKWQIWVIYSLGWVKRNDGMMTYSPHFDRRHNLNFLTSYTFGKKSNFQVDLRFNFGSGFPFSQTQAFYPDFNLVQNIDNSFITSNESLGVLLAEYNASRLPAYHRLDLNFKYKLFLGKRNMLEFNAGATNIYNYGNVFYVDRITASVLYQLPILPSISIGWSF